MAVSSFVNETISRADFNGLEKPASDSQIESIKLLNPKLVSVRFIKFNTPLA